MSQETASSSAAGRAAWDTAIGQACVHWSDGKLEDAERLLLPLVEAPAGNPEALRLLARVRERQGRLTAALALLQRYLDLRSSDGEACCALARLYYRLNRLAEAERWGANAVRLDPVRPEVHNLLGMVFTDQGKLNAGEYHYRRALELHPPTGRLCANLAFNLRKQGRMDAARIWYQKATKLEPGNVETLLGWIRLEEAAREPGRARGLLARARPADQGHPGLVLAEAVLLRRAGTYPAALERLLGAAPAGIPRLSPEQRVAWLFELGTILDRMARFDDAFEAFRSANAQAAREGRRTYGRGIAERQATALRDFFTRERMALLPRAGPGDPGVPAPIFIVGFPRSGTTLLEQMLSSHAGIRAGGELNLIPDLAQAMPALLRSPLDYPECLMDLCLGTTRDGLEILRDYYIRKARTLGAAQARTPRFTDKKPLNEFHLGLIALLFPEAPIVHLIRHPADVVLSAYFNDLTHGYNCAYTLESAAHHYRLVRELVDAYLRNLDLKYLAVRYEDLVTSPEPTLRRVLTFLDLPWEPRCLTFQKNRRYAPTASYAQVTEPLYRDSIFRYRHYLPHLEGIRDTITPLAVSLGYRMD